MNAVGCKAVDAGCLRSHTLSPAHCREQMGLMMHQPIGSRHIKAYCLASDHAVLSNLMTNLLRIILIKPSSDVFENAVSFALDNKNEIRR